MRSSHRLVMVMPYLQLVRKAQDAGCWVGAIWDPALESADYLDGVRATADAFALTNFGDEDALRRAITDMVQAHTADLVVHVGREESMVSVAETATLLDSEVNSVSAVRLLTDKLAMRKHLAAADVSAVAFASAPTRDDVPAALAVVGFPAVVKPTGLSGSRGVFLWCGANDQHAWLGLVDAYEYDGPFIVEEYLRGREYSIETLSVGGEHHVIGITEKNLGPAPLFVELGHVHPAPLAITARAEIEELTVRFLTACGYRTGPAHTEVIVTADGPRIVESQPRLGGDRIPRLVHLSTGLDLERAIFSALDGFAPSTAPHTATAVIRFFAFPPGVVLAVEGVEDVRALPYVDELSLRVHIDDVIAPVRDSRGRHGHVIVSGIDAAEAHARLETALSLLRVVIDGTQPYTHGERPVAALVGKAQS